MFQSTRPLGGATDRMDNFRHHNNCFNPRAPWGARLRRNKTAVVEDRFQSTRPLGGATISKH